MNSGESRKDSAASFLDAGITSFERNDFPSALVFLDLAGKLYSQSDDRWNAGIVRDWYRSAEKKLGHESAPPDW